ncbi:MAG: bifunctional diaminohydroxyphosphoribosylaminopyrimidine deaminase/5-amino-6-(5-phosphoribosylamino)uracil reductase RibD [Bacteroidales bacterium]|nr:bifunctional diaminohydroxyphosphoribosylaminopyrimidine deaminase/5-amino-6-(5-phosphoribosylamino)uracil reductase RibD [Bacteroidales bacterium]NLD64223.1 bifunctional diaminohydroxyphosphoribosylaminopyrimidine deaminase/5-amino-6-(5-phosphoribosylamino)uracil reductase RibD [Bacteroidales bacterium]
MTTPDDLVWMRRALHLARMAEGCTSPNPMVGAVVVHEGSIIGEGYHLRAGTPHAEVHAINAVKDRSLLPESTMYVSLEPCSHHGRTPPCTELIIGSGIRSVVIGTTDTNPQVAGRGAERLRQAGVTVVTGVAEKECRHINRRFFTWHEKKRPYVILKWARSADGYIDLPRSPGDPVEPNWITGKAERLMVHRWRAEEDAILAGGGTVRTDNPSLTVRLWKGRNPVRIIVSRSGNLDPRSAVFDGSAETILFTCNDRAAFPGARIFTLPENGGFIEETLKVLYDMGIQSLFVEGGAFIIRSFIESGLWDEARRFTGRVIFNDGVPDPFPQLTPAETIHFEKSILEFAYHF